jgi:hypothetical protein
MTAKQGITIASRILTTYFLTLAAFRLMDITAAIMSFMHNSSEGYLSSPSTGYYYRIEIETFAHIVLTIALALMMALAFYRCGPKIAQFLLPPIAGEDTEPGDAI